MANNTEGDQLKQIIKRRINSQHKQLKQAEKKQENDQGEEDVAPQIIPNNPAQNNPAPGPQPKESFFEKLKNTTFSIVGSVIKFFSGWF